MEIQNSNSIKIAGYKNKKKQYGCAPIGNALKGVVSPVYKKNGFFHAELILDWGKIVGDVYSMQCRPIRISGIHPHCCLYIGASRSVAAQLVYIVPQLIKRIHMYFGFAMIENIRFIDDNFTNQTTILSHREIPNTRAPKELVAGYTERTNAADSTAVSIRAPDRRTGNLSALGYIPIREKNPQKETRGAEGEGAQIYMSVRAPDQRIGDLFADGYIAKITDVPVDENLVDYEPLSIALSRLGYCINTNNN